MIKRPLCLIAGGFVLGEVMALLSMTFWLRTVPVLGGFGLYVLWKRRGRGLWWLILPLFFFGGWIRGEVCVERWTAYDQIVEQFIGRVQVRGEIRSLTEKEKGTELRLSSCRGHRGTDWISLPDMIVYGEPGMEAAIGQIVEIKGELKPFDSVVNPGEFDVKAYYRSMGIGGRIDGEDFHILKTDTKVFSDFLRRLRSHGVKILNQCALPSDSGILAAAVLGDKSGLDPEIKDLYQKSGISHLLAISGLHLSIIGMGLYRIVRKAGLGFWSSAFVGTCFILAYGIMTGGSASVSRAVSMMILSFAAACLGRTYDMISAASLALMILGIDSPWMLLQGGTQLSYGAVFATGGISPVVQGWMGEKSRWKSALAVSLSIQAVTLPMILFHFFQFPLYGIILNFLVVPFMGAVVCSGMAVIVGGTLWKTAGIWAAGTGHYILTLYEILCRMFLNLPGSVVLWGRPEPLSIGIYYGALGAGLLWMRRTKEPAEKNKKGEEKNGRMLVLILSFILLVFVLKQGPAAGLRVLYMDVGQGDGMVLTAGRKTILIDGGSTSKEKLGEYSLEPCLKSLGISQITAAFITHCDKDHYSGVEYLLKECEEISIETLYLPWHGQGQAEGEGLAALARNRGVRVEWTEADERWEYGRLKISCLYPGREDIPGDQNEQSLVLQVRYGRSSFLFTGDMSSEGERRLLKKGMTEDTDVLKVAHHGSRYSTCGEFLDTISPEIAVISYGKDNSYGHPHREAVERLKERGIAVLETGKMGALWLETDGKRIRWKCWGGTGEGVQTGRESH